MASASGADILVSWIRGRAARVTNRRFADTGDLANDFLHAPKAAAGQDGRFVQRSLDQTRFHERFEIPAISGLVHFFQGNDVSAGCTRPWRTIATRPAASNTTVAI